MYAIDESDMNITDMNVAIKNSGKFYRLNIYKRIFITIS